VEFTLTEHITNGATSIVPNNVFATLNSSGQITQPLTANNDAGTVPVDSQWRVDIRIQGITPVTYYIVIPTGGGSYDLGTLLPGAQQIG
jgi:hypothetical protein